MKDNSTGTIFLPTLSAASLFEFVIKGQLSDGMWENTVPLDHWKFWCRLNVAYAPSSPPHVRTEIPYACLKTGYNIAGLYKYICDRMLSLGQMTRAAEQLGRTALLKSEEAQAAEYMPNSKAQFQSLLAEDKISSYVRGNLSGLSTDLVDAYYDVKYEMKDLRADVRCIKQAMKNVSGRKV